MPLREGRDEALRAADDDDDQGADYQGTDDEHQGADYQSADDEHQGTHDDDDEDDDTVDDALSHTNHNRFDEQQGADDYVDAGNDNADVGMLRWHGHTDDVHLRQQRRLCTGELRSCAQLLQRRAMSDLHLVDDGCHHTDTGADYDEQGADDRVDDGLNDGDHHVDDAVAANELLSGRCEHVHQHDQR